MNAAAHSCTTIRLNADSTEFVVCYQWHPWNGTTVTVVRMVRRRDGDVAHVRRDVDGRSQLLELPVWMLDRSTCADMQLSEQPHLGCEHLQQLRELLLTLANSTATMDRHPGTPSSGDANAISSSSFVDTVQSVPPDPETTKLAEPAARSTDSRAGVAESTVARPKRASAPKGTDRGDRSKKGGSR